MNFYTVLPATETMPDNYFVKASDRVTYVAQRFTGLNEAMFHANLLELESGIPQVIEETSADHHQPPRLTAVYYKEDGEWKRKASE